MHLPELIAEARPVAVVTVEYDRFASLAYVLVIVRRGKQPHMTARVHIRDALEDIQQVITLIPFRDISLYKFPVHIVCALQVGGWEIGANVPGDDIRVPGIAATDVPDILHELPDCPLASVSYPVIERPVSQLRFHERADHGIEVLLRYLHLHESGYDFPWPRTLPDK